MYVCERHQKHSQIWIIQKNRGIFSLNTFREVLTDSLNQTPKTKLSLSPRMVQKKLINIEKRIKRGILIRALLQT